MIAVLVTMAGFSVNLAYIQLLRTQQKVAADAAAKAAVEALIRTESQSAAKLAAEAIAGMHDVGSSTLTLNPANIDFGHSEQQLDGTFNFVTNQSPINSARIVSNIGFRK